MNRHERRRQKVTGDSIVGPITPEGKLNLQSDKPMMGNRPMTTQEQLMVEIVAQTGGNLTVDHLTSLMQQTVAHYRSIDKALAAIKSGDIGFEPVADLTVETIAKDCGQTVQETMDAMKELEKHGLAIDDGDGHYLITMPGKNKNKRIKNALGAVRYSRNH